jgi:benzylsuccinate CoA-transferase BbsF subunit
VASRRAHADELDERIASWTRQRDAYEVMEALQEADIAAGVVQNVEDLFRRDPQLAARGFFEHIEHVKKGSVVATGIPVGLTATPGRSGRAGAALGQDNEYVFGSLLGLSPQEIRRCIESGVIEEPEPS